MWCIVDVPLEVHQIKVCGCHSTDLQLLREIWRRFTTKRTSWVHKLHNNAYLTRLSRFTGKSIEVGIIRLTITLRVLHDALHLYTFVCWI